jgi:hypothetical protein
MNNLETSLTLLLGEGGDDIPDRVSKLIDMKNSLLRENKELTEALYYATLHIRALRRTANHIERMREEISDLERKLSELRVIREATIFLEELEKNPK